MIVCWVEIAVWMGVGCPCPLVRDDIVTPRHLFVISKLNPSLNSLCNRLLTLPTDCVVLDSPNMSTNKTRVSLSSWPQNAADHGAADEKYKSLYLLLDKVYIELVNNFIKAVIASLCDYY